MSPEIAPAPGAQEEEEAAEQGEGLTMLECGTMKEGSDLHTRAPFFLRGVHLTTEARLMQLRARLHPHRMYAYEFQLRKTRQPNLPINHAFSEPTRVLQTRRGQLFSVKQNTVRACCGGGGKDQRWKIRGWYTKLRIGESRKLKPKGGQSN